MLTNINNLSGKMLIAVPGMEDPNFSHAVVLICEHSGEGAFGLIVNRTLMTSYLPLLKAFDIKSSVADLPVYYGGPVNPDQGYVIYTPYDRKYGAIRITDTLAVTASKEILQDIARGMGPEKFIFALGFAGWTSNQLEEELVTDSWLVAPLDQNIVFNAPVNDRWRMAAGTIGVDFERFINRSGMA
ncbi:MAG: YqgE/AlgH family protein [Nitrospirae bacterium]|nr:YqgE/AlgH family protein [Nitrospirota bacterium]